MADTKPVAEQKAKPAADAVAEYELADETLEHNGRRFYRARGDKVPLTHAEADVLIRLGAVKG